MAVSRPAGRSSRFDFAFEPRMQHLARLFGVGPGNAWVEVDAHHLVVRFGHWSLRTPLTNVSDVTVSGPYSWWRVAGPPRLSLADRGITFATTTERGLCVSFHEPVHAILPTSALRHPSATATVADPEALAASLAAGRPRASRPS